MDYELYPLGAFETQAGETIEGAFLAYRTWGRLNAAGDNCIIVPSYYTGTHRSYEAMIGPGRALDPELYFIVLPNLFGNGLSSSPSNMPGPFPATSIADNVRAQHQLATAHLGVRRIALATGWSMGAMQAFAWAAIYPDEVERLLPWCGSASCWPLNQVFLEGLERTVAADPSASRKDGLRAFGRAYAGWAYSAGFYRDALFRNLGFASQEAFLTWWEEDHMAWDADDLLHQLRTWHDARPDRLVKGADLAGYLRRIRARTVVMPCDQDAYFTLAEAGIEAGLVPGATLKVLRSAFGHCAGAPGRDPSSTALIEAEIKSLLKT